MEQIFYFDFYNYILNVIIYGFFGVVNFGEINVNQFRIVGL